MKIYYNDRGMVKMISDEPLETGLNELDYVPTKDEEAQVKQNYLLKVERDELLFEKSIAVKQADAEAVRSTLKQKAEEGKLTLEDLNVFVKDFL